MLITFDLFIQYSQTRYHWNPWAKPSSTHPMTSFCVRTDFPPSWFMSKTFKKLHTPQILTNHLETWHICSSDQSAQKLSDRILNFETVCPLQPIKIGGDGADFDVSSYLGNALTYRNKIWWHASRLCPKCRKKIWCHFVPRGRCN